MSHRPIVARARKLRREMSLPERMIWTRLKVRDSGGPTFKRQYPYEPYVLDFYCARARLVVEIDGSVHDVGDHPERDEVRVRHLEAQGLMVQRIPASEVLADPDDVVEGILRAARTRMQDMT